MSIPVTKTFLPPIDDYTSYIDKIWENQWITNNGEFVIELEKRLKEYLGVKHLFFVSNGTIALQIAIKALDLKEAIITTPFSYVATVSSIFWENCQPIFADIHPRTFCVSPDAIRKVITPSTSAILATHVYGNPCAVEEIQGIAKKFNLKVIYDAAHAFGVTYKDRSILAYGDISTLSFHATKVFHTTEGGAVITNSDELAHRISYLRNFGHKGHEDFFGLGINGKNSEFHAAMGLCNLKYMDSILSKREYLTGIYNDELEGLPLYQQALPSGVKYNFAYYPVVFETELKLKMTIETLKGENIFPRRYFYPSLNTLNYLEHTNMPVSEDISKRILCLPLFHELKEIEVKRICNLISKIVG